MEFNEYLKDKKIDPAAFQAGDPDQYREFAVLFAQMHPGSFTMQKLFLINAVRRAYPLPQDQWQKEKPASAPAVKKPVLKKPVQKTEGAPASAKPKFRPKPIIKKK